MATRREDLPWSRDNDLSSHEEEKHDERADQVGVEHFVSHLGELNEPEGIQKITKKVI